MSKETKSDNKPSKKEASKKRYFKLGPGASSFHDPKTGLNLATGEVGEIDAQAAIESKAVMNSLANGHLRETDQREFNECELKSPHSDQLTMHEREVAKRIKQGEDHPLINNDGKEKASGSVSPEGKTGMGGQSSVAGGALDDDEEYEDDEDEDDDDDSTGLEGQRKAQEDAAKGNKGKGPKDESINKDLKKK